MPFLKTVTCIEIGGLEMEFYVGSDIRLRGDEPEVVELEEIGIRKPSTIGNGKRSDRAPESDFIWLKPDEGGALYDRLLQAVTDDAYEKFGDLQQDAADSAYEAMHGI